MPDSYSERRGFDSRRTDGNFGIVQLAGRETLNLAIQVRALVPKPKTGHVCPKGRVCLPFFDNSQISSEVGMRQAGTVVTRCSLHVRLVPSEPIAGPSGKAPPS